MKRPRRRPTLTVGELEQRCLLSTGPGPIGTWIGQDGHDLVGPTANAGPDGVQDIHIQLSALPSNRQIVKADIRPYGGGEWLYYASNGGPESAALVRAPGATTADLYVEPYQVETGRTVYIGLTYDDNTTADVWFSGGTADPNLRMPADSLSAQWLGQDGQDLTGPGPAVGPDGFQDAHVALSHLSPNIAITAATLSAPSGMAWEFGTNQDLNANAELIRNASDPSRADFYFSPVADLNGQSLTLSIAYANGKTDKTTLVAGPSNPTLSMPAPAPMALAWNSFAVSWVGQDGQNLTGLGDVHLALTGLPAGRSVVSATLSDEDRGVWSTSPNALPLAFRTGADPTHADVDFPPIRDESGGTLTLRLVLDDGTTLVTRFAGGASDPGLRSPDIAPTYITAAPGADLNALANQYGTVHLTAGMYLLDQPLVLSHPVSITADPGTTLLFSQAATAPTWTAAIKVMSGHTTLNGFAVRFAGPVRWTDSISYGPAVIGTPDNYDPNPSLPIEDLTFSHLDLLSPPPATSWEAAPSLFRLVSAQSGTIADNTLKGGTTEFFGGPWQFVRNNDLGTVPGTYTDGVVGGHYTHDVTIADNHVQPDASSGKTWRFLVLTQGGVNDVIKDNTVVGVGPLDSDTIPNPNASEIILTESYRLHFEGMTSSVSADGWIVQIPTPQGGPAQTGDVLAILSGPQAGQWRLIAQALGPTTYLLDAPITPGKLAVSITQAGFVNETFQGNTVDARGSSTATDLVLSGNLFGTQVLDNHLLGGTMGFNLDAYPTEQPNIWGWSHAPVLGAVVAGNTIEDARVGGVIDVVHSAYVKSNQGRVYLSATVNDNTVVWSDAFLAQLAQGGPKRVPLALAVGELLSLDPAELLLTAQGNQAQQPPNIQPGKTLQVNSAVLNGQTIVNQGLILPTVPPAPPTRLRLVNDDGISASDGITSDARLMFDADPEMAGYEYSLSGAAGTYQPVDTPVAFLPGGLAPGFNAVFIRAFDATGQRGPVEMIAFVDDLSAGGNAVSTPSSSQRYEYRIGNSGPFIPLGTALTVDPSALAQGTSVLQVRTVGQGQNVGSSGNVNPGLPIASGAPGNGTPAAAGNDRPAHATNPATVFGLSWGRFLGQLPRPRHHRVSFRSRTRSASGRHLEPTSLVPRHHAVHLLTPEGIHSRVWPPLRHAVPGG